MSERSKIAIARNYLRRLENPHATHQIEGLDDEQLHVAARSNTVRPIQRTPIPSGQSDLFDESYRESVAEPAPVHPYARLAQQETDDGTSARAPQHVRAGVTASNFVAECRRIFSQFIPDLERGRLDPQHLAFIDRNKGRLAHERAKLVDALRKYDLGVWSGLKPQFNREREGLTAAKLEEIERCLEKD